MLLRVLTSEDVWPLQVKGLTQNNEFVPEHALYIYNIQFSTKHDNFSHFWN